MSEQSYYCNSCRQTKKGEPSKRRVNQRWCETCADGLNKRMSEIKAERRALGIAQTEPINGVRHG